MTKKNKRLNFVSSKSGFTLVELLIVMVILGTLAGIIASNFRTVGMKSRDAQRKSDLSQITKALELFINDHKTYPTDSSGRIVACPYRTDGSQSAACLGSVPLESRDANNNVQAIYIQRLMVDPQNPTYIYYYDASSAGDKFQLFAYMENENDSDVAAQAADFTSRATTPSCGANTCNFAVTSSNTNISEVLN